jgi:hypothetical protein
MLLKISYTLNANAALFLKGAKEMENLGFIFGIIGMSMGITGFIFGINSLSKIDKLEKRLKELDVLNEDFKSS